MYEQLKYDSVCSDFAVDTLQLPYRNKLAVTYTLGSIVRERPSYEISSVLRFSNPGGAVMFPVWVFARIKYICAGITEV